MATSIRDLVQLHVLPDPLFDQNCYVLRRRDSDAALVFDPGLQFERALRLLEDEGLRCERVLLTHGHGDHIRGVPEVRRAHGCPAAIHPADRFLLDKASWLPGVPDDLGTIECDEELADGQVIRWRELDLAVLHTPGHTPGSVCFLAGEDLVAGDTLFRRSVGRADLPGGDWETLMVSIRDRLYALPPETVVHPGHGEATTIAEEMEHNPFVVHPRFR